MMTVYVKNKPPYPYLRTASAYFDDEVEPDWMTDDFVKAMVQDVDKSYVFSMMQCVHRNGRPMTCLGLSGGVKGLIMILKDEKHRAYSSAIFGGNCVRWLAHLSHLVDFDLYMEHPLEFISGGDMGFLPITAQTEDGIPMKICREVWRYYIDNCDEGED